MAIQNPWHDIPIGDNAPEMINTIIEIPKDSKIKYELDKDTGMLKLDRFMYSAVHYPGDYGFVPQTLWEDGDPLDIIIFTTRPLDPLTLAEVRVIGVMRMIDDEESDDKILGVYDCDPRWTEATCINSVPQHLLRELDHFFRTYKELQGKEVMVKEFLDRDVALEDIKRAQKMYWDKYGEQ